MATPPSGSVRVDRLPDVVLVTLVGEVDLPLCDSFVAMRGSLARETRPVLVDCGQVTLLTCAGIAALVELGAVGADGVVTLAASGPAVEFTLAAAGYTTRLAPSPAPRPAQG